MLKIERINFFFENAIRGGHSGALIGHLAKKNFIRIDFYLYKREGYSLGLLINLFFDGLAQFFMTKKCLKLTIHFFKKMYTWKLNIDHIFLSKLYTWYNVSTKIFWHDIFSH